MQAAVSMNKNYYDDAFEAGYQAALKSIREVTIKEQNEKKALAAAEKAARHERRVYFAIQRAVGAGVILASVAALAATGSDFGLALVTIPAGLFFMLTNRRIFG